jgi:adenosylmethionine-8-amino-7-oxononanoate aminotransferase
LLAEATRIADRLGSGLHAIAADGGVDHVRGDGDGAVFGVGLRPDQSATALRDSMLHNGVITRAIGEGTITLCPPLVTTDEHSDRSVDVLATSLPSSIAAT